MDAYVTIGSFVSGGNQNDVIQQFRLPRYSFAGRVIVHAGNAHTVLHDGKVHIILGHV
jgi:hypothetical protein